MRPIRLASFRANEPKRLLGYTPKLAGAEALGDAAPASPAGRPPHVAQERFWAGAPLARPGAAVRQANRFLWGDPPLALGGGAGPGLVPALATTAAAALCLAPWAPSWAARSQQQAWPSLAWHSLGAHLGMASLATGLTCAATAFSLAQLSRRLWLGEPMGLGEALGALLPQLAMGLALAPCAASSAALCGPAGLLAVGAACLLSASLVAQRQGLQAPSVLRSAHLLCGALLIGGPAWGVLCGLAANTAVAEAVGLYALSLASTAVGYAVATKVLQSAPTPYLEEGLLAPHKLEAFRFERPGDAQPGAAPASEKPATILDVHPSLWQIEQHLRREIPAAPEKRFHGFCGQPIFHLHGPAGSGKTLSAAGLARELGAYFRATDANELEADRLGDLPTAAINACLLLLSADAFGRRLGRPVLLLLDEVDALLPAPDGPQTNARINKALGYNLFVQILRLLQRNGSFVVVLTATNHFGAYAPMLTVMGQHGELLLDAPTEASKRKVFRAALHGACLDLRERYALPWAPMLDTLEQPMERLMARCTHGGSLSLRSMANLTRVAAEATVGEALRQQSVLPRGQRPGAAAQLAVAKHAFWAMHRELDEQAGRPQSAASPPQTTMPQAAAGHRVPRAYANLDQLLQQTGLRDTSLVRVFQNLSENLVQEYPNPANAVRFAVMELRLANVFWLALLQLSRSPLKVPDAAKSHQQVYVPAPGRDWLPNAGMLGRTVWHTLRAQLSAAMRLRRYGGA